MTFEELFGKNLRGRWLRIFTAPPVEMSGPEDWERGRKRNGLYPKPGAPGFNDWVEADRQGQIDECYREAQQVCIVRIASTGEYLAGSRIFRTDGRLEYHHNSSYSGWEIKKQEDWMAIFLERHREFYVGPFESDAGIIWLKEWPGSTNPLLATLFKIYPRRWYPNCESLSYRHIEAVRGITKEARLAGVSA